MSENIHFFGGGGFTAPVTVMVGTPFGVMLSVRTPGGVPTLDTSGPLVPSSKPALSLADADGNLHWSPARAFKRGRNKRHFERRHQIVQECQALADALVVR